MDVWPKGRAFKAKHPTDHKLGPFTTRLPLFTSLRLSLLPSFYLSLSLSFGIAEFPTSRCQGETEIRYPEFSHAPVSRGLGIIPNLIARVDEEGPPHW